MPNIEGQKRWSAVRLLETHELARGGVNGNLNEQAKALADRTEFLNQEKANKSEIVQGVFEFGTYTEFDSIKSTLPANCTVVISEENTSGTGTWGAGNNRWNGISLVKSIYDPFTQAKADATTKADAAKTEAIDAAATDATTKANAAETNAKVYADTRSEEAKADAKQYTKDNALIKTPQTKVYDKNNIASKPGRYFPTVEGFYDPTATGMCTELIPINPNFDFNISGIVTTIRELFFFDSDQRPVAVGQRGLATPSKTAAYIPANAAFVAFNTNISTTNVPNFILTQTINEVFDEIGNAPKPLVKNFYNQDNLELIPGAYNLSGVTEGGFHVKIPAKVGEQILQINRNLSENTGILIEVGDLKFVAASSNDLASAINILPYAYFVLNVADTSVTNAADVRFEILTFVDPDLVIALEHNDHVTKQVFDFSKYPKYVGLFSNSNLQYTYNAGYRFTAPLRFNASLPVQVETDDDVSSSFFFFDEELICLGYVGKVGNVTIQPEEVPKNSVYISKNLSSVKNAVIEVYSRGLDKKPRLDSDVILALPPLIPVAVGVQMNLYYDNFRASPVNSSSEMFVYEGAKPTSNLTNPWIFTTKQTERAIQWQPTSANVTKTITAEIRYADSYTAKNSVSTTLVSVPHNNGAGRRKITMLCGDSQIDTTYDNAKTSFAPFLKDLFDQQADMNMLFVGKERMTETVVYGGTPAENRTVSCNTESYGGMQVNWFYGSSSPFWNPAKSDVDFINYIDTIAQSQDNQGLVVGDQIDYFVFPMGINDWQAGQTSVQIIDRIKTMQSKVWRDFPGCVFIVALPTQGSKFWSMDGRRKWNIEYYAMLINEFTKPEYSGKVFIAANGIWTDNIYGSRQVRPFREPYKRIVDSKNLLINKLVQSGLTFEQAEEKVVKEYGLEVKERVMERWLDEYPVTTDIVHSSWVSAMQQADCLYSALRYLLQNP